jgi:uncharacterized membrane protein required for colicin V production
MIDAVIGAVLLVAVLRGLTIGLIRESFSIAALGAAVLAARYGAEPGAAWLIEVTGGETGPFPPTWVAGTALAIGAAFGVAAIGYAVRRGARLVGLSFVDRLGGGALGAAEGAVVALLVVLGTTFVIGRDHPVVSGSRSLAAYDALRAYWDERAPEDLPEVAAPGSSWQR